MNGTRRVVIYGKGGIGKSTVCANLSMVLAGRGLRVLHVGCDPKHDSTYTLVPGPPIPTLIDGFLAGSLVEDGEGLVTHGRRGIHCIEAGGPRPGTGCAGRGVLVATERIGRAGLCDEGRYDVVLFDVVGDVVCGGFAAPLQAGLGQTVYLVVSEDIMSLYAGNNVAHVVLEYADAGARLGGIIANRLEGPDGARRLRAFAERIGTRVVAELPRDPSLARSEYDRVPLVEHTPEAPFARRMAALADEVLRSAGSELPLPHPLDEAAFERFVREVYYAPAAGAGP